MGKRSGINTKSLLDKYTLKDNIQSTISRDNFYDYSLLQADGKRLLADFATTERDNTNAFGIYVKNTDLGIYRLKDSTVQTEHAVVIDNTPFQRCNL